MPRSQRNLLEGGLYHVYNRFARGEQIFADRGEAERFHDLVREVKRRDGFLLYAWCLMSNHYHLAMRTLAVPLSRTLGFLQGGFSRSFQSTPAPHRPGLAVPVSGEAGRRPAPLRLKLPWWARDRDPEPKEGRTHVDLFGRSTGLERPRLDAVSFVDAMCRLFGAEVSVVASHRKDRATTRHRELLASLGIERWGQRAGELGRVLGKHPDMVSRWARRAGMRRAEAPELARRHDELDHALAKEIGSRQRAPR